ncbi:hypothetical protein Tco_1263663 [Tanacetum coccineum]
MEGARNYESNGIAGGRTWQYEVAVRGMRVRESVPIMGNNEAVGRRQKDENAPRSGSIIGWMPERTNLPLPLGCYINRRIHQQPVVLELESVQFCFLYKPMFDKPPQYSINHQEDLNQQRISDVHDGWDKLEESYNEIFNMPSDNFKFNCDDDDDDEEYSIPLKDMPKISPSIALAPVSSIMKPEDSLIMGNEELSTIPEKESDEFIKSNSTFLFTKTTPLSDSNEMSASHPERHIELLLHHDPSISVVSILEGFTDEPPLKENDDLFDLESKENEWKKILYDAPIEIFELPRKQFSNHPRDSLEEFFSDICELNL